MTSSNLGNIDWALRILLGLSLIGLAATGRLGASGSVRIVPLLTGVFAWCPLYRLFSFRTTSR